MNEIIQCLSAFVGCLGFTFIFRIHKNIKFACVGSIVGTLGWVIYLCQHALYATLGYVFGDTVSRRLWLSGFKASQSLLGLLLYLRAFEDGDFASAWAIGAVLLVLVLVINLAARLAKAKLKQKQ